ncbi:hypothetical protein [Ulvibacter antarcticus]|uniref:Lipoprotein n=1 Tax=Ulvibacter antarcticus TaxID=442714 RepID=A0A3L9YDZ2_9FLAO|nr:hypothetical protein [Ulvibacter antarcticus]RMA57269.1 hypothetical protein BXY75_3156 [Ulvibacter antarcticus]
MKKLKLLFIVVVASLCFNSCSDCTDETDTRAITPFDVPTPQEFEQIQTDVFDGMIQLVQVDVTNGFNYVAASGVTISISPNCLQINGLPVTGIVDLEIAEFYDKGEMLISNTTTVGNIPGAGRDLLISGGAFFIRVSQNGVFASLACSGFISVPTGITGGNDPDMLPFSGSVNAAGNLEWTQINGEVNIDIDTYYTQFPEFGWFNIDRFLNDPRPTTAVQVAVPQEFNSENTRVYLALQGEPNSLAYLYGELPIGLEVHIIFLSESNGDFRYAVETLTLEQDQLVIFTRQQTEVVTAAVLKDRINALP